MRRKPWIVNESVNMKANKRNEKWKYENAGIKLIMAMCMKFPCLVMSVMAQVNIK